VVGGHSVLLVDRHVLLSPSVLSRAYRLVVCAVVSEALMARAPLLRAMRFGVESRLASGAPGAADHSSRTKSVMRDGSIFARQMVTGEFYALVTASWITPGSTRTEAIRDKRPACRWLRLSRRNCADQGSIVM